ncbi:MAG: class I SAM-dependent methyltransferase [Ginsengibacter sp.]
MFFWFLKQKKIKINVGSAAKNFDNNWLATDIETLNLTKIKDWKKLLFFLKVDNIMAEHVWEHLTELDTELANQNCFKFLKKGGILRIAVPDGFHPNTKYIDHVKPGGRGSGAEDHKILYNYKLMTERLQKVGFKVQLLEYWDENGKFHFIDWSDEGGHIRRSKRYDRRNQNGTLSYTSLIVDAVKP